MASPVLSRSPSATFAPGPHRRSHPNLQNLHHLSLAPLTPKYPIDPADYDAYYDPNTSELHSSASISHISGLPSPGGILTNSPARSRNPSRTRRKIKSTVHIQIPNDELTQHRHDAHGKELGDNDIIFDLKPVPKSPKQSATKSQPQLHKLHTDPSWLVQTGLSLTESSRETKGQSWISKRDSSTSLANAPTEAYFDARRPRDGRTPRSGRATPARSRVTSRNVSRNASRTRLHDLRLTATSPEGTKITPSASFATAPDGDDKIREEDEAIDTEDVEPNWSDARTQAEMAAHIQSELADEFEGFSDDGDPYGMLNFEEQGSDSGDDAEEEVRKAMRSWRVGGWMDGAIEALLMVEEENAGMEDMDGQRNNAREMEEGSVGDTAESPAERVQGAWPDLWWFGRIVRRQVNV